VPEIWHYAGQGGPVGPVSVRDLKDALATFSNPKDVLVWRDGFSRWARAGDVPELKGPKTARPTLRSKTLSKARLATSCVFGVIIIVSVSIMLLQQEENKHFNSCQEVRSIPDCTSVIQALRVF
jgi:hypothetical protein